MKSVLSNNYQLNDQLNGLLLEKKLNLSEKKLKHYKIIALQQCITRLQNAALNEGLIDKKINNNSLYEYLDLLKKNHSTCFIDRWDTLKNELDESIVNQTLALAYFDYWQKDIKNQAQGYPSLWMWLHNQHSSEYILTFLEQWGCTGHPYHPNFRAKIGFNPYEVVQYAPEFKSQVTIHWAAIHSSIAFTSGGHANHNHLFAHHFTAEYKTWAQTLQTNDLNPESYLPLPIHPWQWENKLKSLYAPLMNSGQLHIVHHLQKTHPSMSFRTMIPDNNLGPHLKLATAVHTTSALRTVSPASVSNSTPLSIWISQLLVTHQHFSGRLFLASDLAGINIAHESITPQEKKLSGMILRENPVQFINKSQTVVPVAALFGISPITEKALLIEIIEASAIAPEEYFIKYCQCILESQLQLLLQYGLALEAHQQNTLVVFQNHLPEAVIIRDLGGIKLCLNPLYDQIIKPTLHPESTITCTGLKNLSNAFIHGNLLSNIAFWVNCLHQHYKLSEKQLWFRVWQIINGILNQLQATIKPEIYHHYKQYLLSKPWQQKSLLTMRLNENQDQPVFFVRPNPLSHFNE